MSKGSKRRPRRISEREWAARHAATFAPGLWWEEYRCGCVSEIVPKDELPGYCPVHGEDRRLGPLRELEVGNEA